MKHPTRVRYIFLHATCGYDPPATVVCVEVGAPEVLVLSQRSTTIIVYWYAVREGCTQEGGIHGRT